MDLPADDGISFLLFAQEREEEAILLQRWMIGYQAEMSFEDFKAELRPKTFRGDAELLTDIEGIMTSWEVKNGII